jgi:Protein of unknown function (DUF2997)
MGITRSASVPHQVLRYRIRPDGRVEELVEGLAGSACTALTAAIEARLGPVVTSMPTGDHYVAAATSVLTDTVPSPSHVHHVALQHGPH